MTQEQIGKLIIWFNEGFVLSILKDVDRMLDGDIDKKSGICRNINYGYWLDGYFEVVFPKRNRRYPIGGKEAYVRDMDNDTLWEGKQGRLRMALLRKMKRDFTQLLVWSIYDLR